VDDLKAALDTMNKQYNQLKVGAEGLLQENEDLKGRCKHKTLFTMINYFCNVAEIYKL